MSFNDEERIAEMDHELSRPWLKDLRTKSLMESASHTVGQYGTIRAVDRSGVVGELLDLLEAVTARLSAMTDALDREGLAEAIADRLSWPSMHWDWRTPAAHKAIADAVRRHVLGEEQH